MMLALLALSRWLGGFGCDGVGYCIWQRVVSRAVF